MSTTFAVLDTNIFLHFQPFDQIKWTEVLGGSPVTLVVPAVVMRELDRVKDSHPRHGIQDRAHGALEKIKKSELESDNLEIPDYVDLTFKEEASISFEEYSLQESIEDDRILASCIELQKDHPNAQIILVTDDTTPQLKAARRDLEIKELPEKYRLQSARGELEKENRRLKQKIQKIENRLPKLDLVFQNGKKYSRNTIDSPSSTLAEEEINERIEEIREEYPPKDPPSTEAPSGGANTVGQMIKQLQRMPGVVPPASEYRRYNDDREEYLEKYREYLNEINQYKRFTCRTVSVDVRLINEGTAPAEDIDVSMHFPDGLQLLAEGDLPEHPEEPAPPELPQKSSLVSQIPDSGLHTPDIPTAQLPTSTSAPNVSSPEIEELSSFRASFHVRRLKHDREASFDSLYVVYPSIEDAFSFEISYRIHSASLPEEETGELQVAVEN